MGELLIPPTMKRTNKGSVNKNMEIFITILYFPFHCILHVQDGNKSGIMDIAINHPCFMDKVSNTLTSQK